MVLQLVTQDVNRTTERMDLLQVRADFGIRENLEGVIARRRFLVGCCKRAPHGVTRRAKDGLTQPYCCVVGHATVGCVPDRIILVCDVRRRPIGDGHRRHKKKSSGVNVGQLVEKQSC